MHAVSTHRSSSWTKPATVLLRAAGGGTRTLTRLHQIPNNVFEGEANRALRLLRVMVAAG